MQYHSIKGKSLQLSKSSINMPQEDIYYQSAKSFERIAKIRKRRNLQSLSMIQKQSFFAKNEETRKSSDQLTLTASGTKMTTFYQSKENSPMRTVYGRNNKMKPFSNSNLSSTKQNKSHTYKTVSVSA